MESMMVKQEFEDKIGRVLQVEFGLSYHRGNSGRYFSITGALYSKRPLSDRNCEGMGAMGDRIVEWHKENYGADSEEYKMMKLFNDLHLSEEDGTPMHAVANIRFFIEQYLDVSEYLEKYKTKEQQLEMIRDYLRVETVGQCEPYIETIRNGKYGLFRRLEKMKHSVYCLENFIKEATKEDGYYNWMAEVPELKDTVTIAEQKKIKLDLQYKELKEEWAVEKARIHKAFSDMIDLRRPQWLKEANEAKAYLERMYKITKGE